MEPVAIGRQHLQQDAELGSGLKEAEVVHDAGVGEGLQQADLVLWLSHDQMVEDPANPPPPNAVRALFIQSENPRGRLLLRCGPPTGGGDTLSCRSSDSLERWRQSTCFTAINFPLAMSMPERAHFRKGGTIATNTTQWIREITCLGVLPKKMAHIQTSYVRNYENW